MRVRPETFRKEHFGIGSSHPAAQRKTLVVFALAAFAPLALLAAVAILLTIEFPELLFELDTLSQGAQLGLMAFVFGLGFLATVALSAGVSRRLALEDDRDAAPDNVGLLWIFLGVLFGIAIPVLGPNEAWLPDTVRFLCRVSAVLPVMLLLAFIAGGQDEGADEDGKVPYNRPLLSTFAAVVGLLAIQTLLVSILEHLGHSVAWGSLGGLLPFMDSLPNRVGASAVLIPLLALLMAIRRTWPAMKVAHPDGEKPAGLFRRLVRFILAFLGLVPRSAAPEKSVRQEEDDGKCPEWLQPLLEEADLSATPFEKAFEGPTSPFETSRPDLATFFGGITPTRDQVLGLERFLRLHDDSLEATRRGESEAASSDLLLLGDHGAGRSRTLHACILAATIVRGQGALVIVPDGIQRQNTVDRVQRDLDALGMRDFLAVDALDGQLLGPWIQAQARAIQASEEGNAAPESPAPLPEIMVATLDELERQLFGRQCSQSEAKALRQLLACHDAVFVEDLDHFRGPRRAHLPFVLDKLRLFQSAIFRRPQVVVVGPRMDPAALSVVGERLFGVRAFDTAQNTVTLQPRAVDPCWMVELKFAKAEEIEEARERLSRLATGKGLNTLLYVRAIDEDTARVQEQRLAEGNGRLQVVGELDRLDLLDGADPDLALYTASLRTDELVQLRAGASGRTVIVSLGYLSTSTESLPEYSTDTVPIFPPREAEALGALHLATSLPLLPPSIPVPAAAWMDVGFAPQLADAEDLLERPLGTWRLDEIPGRDDIERLVVLRSNPPTAPAIDTSVVLPADRWRLGRSRSDGTFHLRLDPRSEGENRALAAWRERSEEGTVIAPCELAHVDELELERKGRRLVPRTLQERSDGRLAIIAMPAQGDGRDATHPLLDLTLEFPESCDVRVSFHSPDRGVAVVAAQTPNCVLHTDLVGLATEYGTEQQFRPYRFSQSTWAGALLLGPRKLHQSDIEPVLRRLFSRRRSTRSHEDAQFLPALTAALNRAFSLHFEGSPWFARVAAFSLEDLGKARPAEAVCFLLQPEAVHHAVSSSADIGLRSDPLTEAFLKTAADVLEHCSSLNPADQSAYLRSLTSPCIGVDGDLQLTRSSAALKAAMESEGRNQQVSAAWQVHHSHPDLVPASTDGSSRGWDPAGAAGWDVVAGRLRQALEAALEAVPELSWRLTLLEVATELGEDALRAGAEPHWTVRDGADRYTLTPQDGTGAVELEAFVAEVLPTLCTDLPSSRPPTLELRLWGEQVGVRRREGEPAALDLRLEIGLLPDGKITLTRLSESAPARVSGAEGAPIELLRPVTPEELKDPEAAWSALANFQAPMVGRGQHTVTFHHGGRAHEVSFGMPDPKARAAFMKALEGLDGRAAGPRWDSHLLNDPFPAFIPQLSEHLQRLYGRAVDADYAAFVLSFIQALPYIADPEGPTDWARFPSEYFTLGGGDCEDSSLAMVALLNDAGLDAAYLGFQGHLAVGVRGPFEGRYYEHEGHAWFLAETAVHAGALPLGTPPETDAPLHAVLPTTLRESPKGTGACFLGARIEVEPDGAISARVTVHTTRPGLQPVLVAQRRPLSTGIGTRSHRAAEVQLPESPNQPAVLRFSVPLDFAGDGTIGETAVDFVLWDARQPGTRLAFWEQAGTLISTLLADD
jgi:hypothetical protein